MGKELDDPIDLSAARERVKTEAILDGLVSGEIDTNAPEAEVFFNALADTEVPEPAATKINSILDNSWENAWETQRLSLAWQIRDEQAKKIIKENTP